MKKIFNRKKLKNESGVALIPVLCLIFTGSLMVMMALAYSQMNSYIINPHTELQKSIYRTEGVANRVYWLTLMSAAKSRSNPDFLTFDYADADEEYFFTDGRTHQVNYYGYPMEFLLLPQEQGINLTQSGYRQTLTSLRSKFPLDTEYNDLIDRTMDILKDYFDADDNPESNGAESAEYELAGMESLPRNADMQWREELLYIPEIRQLFPLDSDGRLSSVCLAYMPSYRRTTPSIFSATPEMLKRFAGLEDNEVASVYQAIQNYKLNGTSISDQLDESLLTKVRSAMGGSISSSGNYISVVIRPSSQITEDENGDAVTQYPSRRLAFTFAKGSISHQIRRYMEWQYF